MLNNRFVFNLGAWIYDTFTSQQTWWNHCKKLSPKDFDPDSILDVGCGPGISAFVLEELNPDATIVGMDIAEKMIRQAMLTKKKQGSDVDFFVGDAGHLPFSNAKFDLVTGHSFLYLVPDRRGILAEIHRVLTPGGRVTFLEPRRNPGFEWFYPSLRQGFRFFSTMIGWQVFSSLHGRFDRTDIETMFTEVGFEDVESEITLNGLGWICRAKKRS